MRVATIVKETPLQLKLHTDPHAFIVGDFNLILTNGQVLQTKTKQRTTRANCHLKAKWT